MLHLYIIRTLIVYPVLLLLGLAQTQMKTIAIVRLLSLVALIFAEVSSAGKIRDETEDAQFIEKRTSCSKSQLEALEAKLLAQINSLKAK